ncbi:hypothetical protein [Aquabacterium sp.]|uniref:hypothetical protein n=1 Tax=Aquabacterium sp. TaxID=1872578 RepID=UPI003D6D006C
MRAPMLMGLILALALTAWVALQEDDAAVEPTRRADAPSRVPAPGQRASAGKGKSPAAAVKPDASQAQLLVQSVAQWQSRPALAPWPSDQANPWASQRPPPPPPAPVVTAEPPPPPMAPPFPHAWVGRFDDEAQRAVLTGGDATWVVAVGDVIDGQWRIDQIQERQMSLTYLPLQQRQTIAMKSP